MKTAPSFWYTALVVLALVCNLSARDNTRGTVRYRHITRYDFKSVFGTFNNPHADEWVASLPTQSQSFMLLHFTPEKSLFRPDPSEPGSSSELLRVALMKAGHFRPPQTEVTRVYHDFIRNETTRQIEFMTRNFLITCTAEKKAWKLTNKQSKIKNYLCMQAVLEQDEEQITAWFTPEIPVSAGPGEYSGLPGLILAVELNGNTVFVADSVNLTLPDSDIISVPDRGQAMTAQEFEKVRAEKTQEWKEVRKNSTKNTKNRTKIMHSR